MKHIWSIISQNSIIDNETNNISIINVIEEIPFSEEDIRTTNINGKDEQFLPVSFNLITLWIDEDIGQEREKEMLIELHGPDGKKINEFVHKFTFNQNLKRMRSKMIVNGLPFKGFGNYEFKIKEKDKENFKLAGVIPLELRKVIK